MVNLSHPAARAPCLHCAVILKACYCTQPCKGKIGGGKAKTLPFITQTQRRIRQNCAKPWSDLYRVVKEQKIRHAVYRFFEAKSTVI